MDGDWCYFWVVLLWGIHSHCQKCNRAQKERAHAYTFRHLCAFFNETYIFSLGTCWLVSFFGNFIRGIHFHCQKCNRAQKVRTRKYPKMTPINSRCLKVLVCARTFCIFDNKKFSVSDPDPYQNETYTKQWLKWIHPKNNQKMHPSTVT